MHVGGRKHHPIDQARVLVLASVNFHAEVPLVALLGLVYLRIPLPRLIISRTGYDNQDSIIDGSLRHRNGHAAMLSLLVPKIAWPSSCFSSTWLEEMNVMQ